MSKVWHEIHSERARVVCLHEPKYSSIGLCRSCYDLERNAVHNPVINPRNNARNQEARRLLAQTGEGKYK